MPIYFLFNLENGDMASISKIVQDSVLVHYL